MQGFWDMQDHDPGVNKQYIMYAHGTVQKLMPLQFQMKSDFNYQGLASLSKLIDLIYQGATDLAAWQRVPDHLGEWMQASACTIFTPMHTPDKHGFMVTNLSPSTMELWATKYQAHDIWAQRGFEKGYLVTGNVGRDQDLLSEQEFLESTIYKELFKPLDIGRLLTGVVFGAENKDIVPVICSFNRPFNLPFTQQDVDKLELILPHISRALGVMFRLRDAEFRVATSMAALNRLPSGVFLLDADGGVTFANHAAKRILDRGDGLRLRNRPGVGGFADLLAVGMQFQSLLEDAVRDSISPEILSTRHFSRAVTIPKISGKPPFVLHFSSLPAHNEFGVGGSTPRAIAFLSDSATPIRMNADLLKSAYSLTKAEIRTAELVSDGFSLEDAAKQLDVSVNTIKSQLRQIYGKTNTNNRAKLVKLLLALAPAE